MGYFFKNQFFRKGMVHQAIRELLSKKTFETDTTGYTASGYELEFAGDVSADSVLFSQIDFTGEFTLEFIVRSDDYTATRMFYGAGTTNKIGHVNNNWFVRITNGGTANNSVAYPTDGAYHHVIISRDSNNDFYLNVDGTITNLGNESGTSSWIYIGRPDVATQDWDGKLKLYRAFDTYFTESEQTELLNGTSVPNIANLQHEFLFEDGSGTTLTDTSGNSNNGTITGATWVDERPGLYRDNALAKSGNNSLNLYRTALTNWNIEDVDISEFNVYVNGGASINPTLSRDATEVYSGSNSLKHVGSGASTFSGFFIQPSLVSGVNYTIRIRHKATAGQNLNIYAGVTGNPQQNFVASGDWETIEFTFANSSTSPNIYIRTKADGATFYIDNIEIWQTNSPLVSGAKHTLTGLTPGQAYIISAYFLQESDTDYCGIIVPGKGQSSVQSDGAWHIASVEFVATAATQDINLVNFTGSNPFYVDDVSLSKSLI